MPVVTNIADLRRMAQKRVAKAIFDYVDRGSYDENTLRANPADLDFAPSCVEKNGQKWRSLVHCRGNPYD